MAIQPRGFLRTQFTQGRRPKQQDFWDWLDSFYHKGEDTIKTAGWQFRSFFKDLRAEGVAITTGGVTVVDIPSGATRLKKIRVLGKGTPSPAPFTITTSLVYYSDKNVPGLNGVPSSGNPFPTNFFAHFLLGFSSVPPATFTIVTPGPQFDGTFDFASIPKDVFMDFIQARFLVLTIRITSGSFPNTALDPSYVYYGLEFE